ncbi:MAG: hypothetical protein LBB78_08795, partial [Spirochaetaceae bacterium]|nr:hypothetical protein [Spirochaetaceae bacterium]
DTEDAPAALQTLSAAAGLPKERASLSFLLTGPVGKEPKVPQGEEKTLPVRILSDRFPLPYRSRMQEGNQNRYGRYGCSARGLVLVIERESRKSNKSGELVMLTLGSPDKRDPKTGALIADSPGTVSKGVF